MTKLGKIYKRWVTEAILKDKVSILDYLKIIIAWITPRKLTGIE